MSAQNFQEPVLYKIDGLAGRASTRPPNKIRNYYGNCSRARLYSYSKIVKERHNYWASKGLYLLSLPPYCSEMNLIENERQRLKEDELAGRMFSDEYELAIAVMEGVKDRYKQDCYEVKRYQFYQE